MQRVSASPAMMTSATSIRGFRPCGNLRQCPGSGHRQGRNRRTVSGLMRPGVTVMKTGPATGRFDRFLSQRGVLERADIDRIGVDRARHGLGLVGRRGVGFELFDEACHRPGSCACRWADASRTVGSALAITGSRSRAPVSRERSNTYDMPNISAPLGDLRFNSIGLASASSSCRSVPIALRRARAGQSRSRFSMPELSSSVSNASSAAALA